MKAVVMAGGSGSRLRPLTIERPKPMIPVVNKSTLGHILNLLKINGITDVIITVQYLASIIQDYYGDGSNLGMNLTYYEEEEPMGTAGGVKNIQPLLDDTFIVVSGDAITDFDLRKIQEFHRQQQAGVTITLYRVPDPLEYGVIVTNSEGYITQLLEKPTWGEVISDTVNTGIYLLEPDILDFIPPGQPYDFSTQLFPKLLAEKVPMAGYVAEGYWCDIGNLSFLHTATVDMLEGKVQYVNLGTHLGGNIWAGGDVEIAPTATLLGPIYLGKSVRIKEGAIIKGPTVIRGYTIVEEHAQVDRSIIWRNCYIGKGVELRGALVLKHCSLKSKSVVYEGAVIGDGSIIGEGAVIHPNVKIWSGKEIEPGATVKDSVIWGSQGRRVLFGQYGVTGTVNVDFTPEFSAKLGTAFGATLPKGSTVIFNRDPHRAPRMLKRAAIAGLPSAGVKVADLGVQPTPVARYFIKISGAAGGMHVRLSPFDPMVVDIRILDEQGLNISKEAERNIERTFFREDFRRVYMDEIGTIGYASRVEETYIEGFLKSIDVKAIQDAKFNLVVDYASAPTATILPGILTELECNVVALNATLDETQMSIPYEAFQNALRRLQIISQALGANLGVRIDVGGETIFVVDDSGRSLSGIDLCAAMVELVLTAHPGGAVAISNSMPHIFERIADKHGGKVIRSKVNSQAVKENLANDVIFAGDGQGKFIFPEFQQGVDGLMAVAKLLECLATQNRQLSDVVSRLPPYYLAQAKVYCMWEAKGSVMRQLSQQAEGQTANTVEGLKITVSDREWALILPCQDQPHIEVIAEAASQATADGIVEEYSQLIKEFQAGSM